MRRQLTALQRRVIQQLREANYQEVADAAQDAWTRAEAHRPAVPIDDPELSADYQRANAQLLTGFVDRRLSR